MPRRRVKAMSRRESKKRNGRKKNWWGKGNDIFWGGVKSEGGREADTEVHYYGRREDPFACHWLMEGNPGRISLAR